MPAPQPRGRARPGNASVRRKIIPTVNFAEAEKQAHAYAQQGALAAGTLASYASNWKFWERHCVENAWDPEDAPIDAFEALYASHNSHGSPLTPGYVDTVVAAVTWHYTQRGKTPSHKDPRNRSRWQQLRTGYQRTVHTSTKTPTRDAMSRDDAVALVTAEVEPDPRVIAGKARNLLLLDGVRPCTVDALTPADITVLDGNTLEIPGTVIPCNHDPIHPGIPRDCTACTLQAAAAHTPRHTPILQHHRIARSAKARAHLTARLAPLQRNTTWSSAGTRRAYALLASTIHSLNELRAVRARAWVAVSWSAGLRMHGDTQHLARQHFTQDPSTLAWKLTLSASKDDPAAQKTVTRTFPWPSGNHNSVALLINEYLCVRDAIAGQEGPLFLRWKDVTPAQPASLQAATTDLQLLTDWSNIGKTFTTYSTRKGYAQQAVDDGWELEQLQEGLRHTALRTTLFYTPDYSPKKTAKKFIQANETPQ